MLFALLPINLVSIPHTEVSDYKMGTCRQLNVYLYRKEFKVKTDNSLFTNILTTAKLDATGH